MQSLGPQRLRATAENPDCGQEAPQDCLCCLTYSPVGQSTKDVANSSLQSPQFSPASHHTAGVPARLRHCIAVLTIAIFPMVYGHAS